MRKAHRHVPGVSQIAGRHNNLCMKIEQFQNSCMKGNIRWSTHGLSRIQQRALSRDDVIHCISTGELIEEYVDDFPTPSALILGKTFAGEPCHVVCGIQESMIIIITAYLPDITKFEADFKTRRIK